MSIQQRIASEAYKLANSAVTTDQIKAVQAHVIKSVQDGSVPSYVGIPLLNDLNQRMGSIQNASAASQAMVNQPPVAQQIMGQAEQGLETLPSRLHEQAMAGGGIVAFAGGGMSDSDMAAYLLADEDDEDDDYVRALMGDIQNREVADAQEEEDEGTAGIAAMPAFRSSMSDARSGEKRTGLQSLLELIEKKESGGKDYDKYGNLLTSSAGAQGRMQVMPATARDPGFGIRPAREGDTEDLARVGKELYGKLLDKYKDPKIAAAAYNWGSGNVDKWLMAGGDESKLPAETRNYVKGFAEGGITRLAGGGMDYMPPADDLEKQKDMLRRLRRIEQAKAAYGAEAAAPAVEAAAPAAEGGLGGLWNAAKSSLGRINPSGSVGWASALYSPDLNQGEDLELAKRRLMTPTIGQAGTSVPLSSVGSTQAAPAGAGAGRGGQGGPNLQQSKQSAFEEAIGNTQDAEDMDAGINALPDREAEKAPAKDGNKGGIDAMLDQYAQDIKGQRETNAYLALLSAGLGMMGGTSPHAMTNIGQGAQHGISTYAGLNQATGADERALLSAKIGAEKYKTLNDIRQAQIAAQQEAKSNANLLGQQRLALSQQKALDETLTQLEAQAEKKVEASGKLAALENIGKGADEIARAKAQMVNNLLAGNQRYQQLYKLRYPGVQESFEGQSIMDYDPKTRSLIK
jgi:hypothetical protein